MCKIGHSSLFIVFLSFYTVLQNKTLEFGRIRTRTVGVEGKQADHNHALNINIFPLKVWLRLRREASTAKVWCSRPKTSRAGPLATTKKLWRYNNYCLDIFLSSFFQLIFTQGWPLIDDMVIRTRTVRLEVYLGTFARDWYASRDCRWASTIRIIKLSLLCH